MENTLQPPNKKNTSTTYQMAMSSSQWNAKGKRGRGRLKLTWKDSVGCSRSHMGNSIIGPISISSLQANIDDFFHFLKDILT